MHVFIEKCDQLESPTTRKRIEKVEYLMLKNVEEGFQSRGQYVPKELTKRQRGTEALIQAFRIDEEISKDFDKTTLKGNSKPFFDAIEYLVSIKDKALLRDLLQYAHKKDIYS